MTESWIQSIFSDYGLYAGTFVVLIISGLVPFVNAELVLIFLATIAPKNDFFIILLLSASGQMVAKSIMFYAGKGTLNISHKKYEDKINRVLEKMKKWENKVDLLILISSFVGFPPFYIVSITTGMVNHSFVRFFAGGFIGRLLRFAIVLYLPHVFKSLFL